MTTSLARPEGRAAPAVGATTSARVGLVLAGVGGIVAAAAYLASVVVGGIIVPGYSHLANSVSELTSPGAPFRGLLGAGFALYNLGVVAVGVGVLLRGPRRIPAVIGAGALAACGVAGVLMIEPFPQDPMGSPLTPAGTVHIALAGVSALGLVLALVLFTVAWWRDAFWRPLRVISVVCAAAILVTGGVGAAMVASPVFGLFERFTQVSFLTWFAVLGVFALRAARGERPGSAHSATTLRG